MTAFLKLFSVAFLLVSAQGAFAQELVFSPELSLSCYYESDDGMNPHECIGLSANACMEATPGGYSTYSMGGCLDAELSFWDQELNAAYGELMAYDKAVDADGSDMGSAAMSRAENLRDMQRAWIGFRDASCDYERSQWGGGTGGGPAFIGCMMQMTGEQAMALQLALQLNQAH
jgi:uncharacterized protein YecT (DUF1311 family)